MEKTSPQFQPGQIWKYHNRPGEDSSTLTILKIEKYEKGDTIIHIRVNGINLYNPRVAGGISHELGHLPYSRETLSKSVTLLLGQTTELPDFMEGYLQWKEAWETGKGGYWTIDLKEAIEAMDNMMRQQK